MQKKSWTTEATVELAKAIESGNAEQIRRAELNARVARKGARVTGDAAAAMKGLRDAYTEAPLMRGTREHLICERWVARSNLDGSFDIVDMDGEVIWEDWKLTSAGLKALCS